MLRLQLSGSNKAVHMYAYIERTLFPLLLLKRPQHFHWNALFFKVVFRVQNLMHVSALLLLHKRIMNFLLEIRLSSWLVTTKKGTWYAIFHASKFSRGWYKQSWSDWSSNPIFHIFYVAGNPATSWFRYGPHNSSILSTTTPLLA